VLKIGFLKKAKQAEILQREKQCLCPQPNQSRQLRLKRGISIILMGVIKYTPTPSLNVFSRSVHKEKRGDIGYSILQVLLNILTI
jgi:hypothetical protein